MNIYKPAVMRIAAARDEAPDVRTLRLEFLDEPARAAVLQPLPRRAVRALRRAGRRGEHLLRRQPADAAGVHRVHLPQERPGHPGPSGPRSRPDDHLPRALRELFPHGNLAREEHRLRRRRHRLAAGAQRHLERAGPARANSATSPSSTARAPSRTWSTRTNWSSGPRRPDVKLVTTVDPGGETPEWKGKIGFVPNVLKATAPAAANSVAVVCGPPIMIKFTLPVLAELGFAPADIYTTLENRMKCGVGKCGRCNVGPMYVCKDGPVFTAEQLAESELGLNLNYRETSENIMAQPSQKIDQIVKLLSTVKPTVEDIAHALGNEVTLQDGETVVRIGKPPFELAHVSQYHEVIDLDIKLYAGLWHLDDITDSSQAWSITPVLPDSGRREIYRDWDWKHVTIRCIAGFEKGDTVKKCVMLDMACQITPR